MKKLAITISAATLIMSGLAGCGVGQQGAQGTGAGHGAGAGHGGAVGFHTTEQADRGFFGWNRAGEGPITDMVTRDDRPGRGFNNVADRNRTGMTGMRGDRPGVIGEDIGRGTGLWGRQPGGAGLGANRGLMGPDRRGAGFGADRGAGFGADRGAGFGGNRGGLFGDQQRPGTGLGTQPGAARGLVGDRPGMVDDTGVLRGRRADAPGNVINEGDILRDGPRHGVTGIGRRQETGRAGAGQAGLGAGQHSPLEMGLGAGQRHTDNYWRFGNETAQQGQHRPGAAGEQEVNYHKDYDGQTVQRISRRLGDVEHVRDARVITHDDTIVVGLDTDEKHRQNVEKEVRTTVEGMADGKTVHVVTDRDQVTRVRQMDDQLRTGTAFEEVGATFRDMVGDLGRMIQRPFERSR